MNCFDDSYINNNINYSFTENIDYLSNDIKISNNLLIKCWKQSKYDISIIIPSTIPKRLENISWRRLYKNLNDLQEVNPQIINWYKDHDINWCYGPKFIDDDFIKPSCPDAVIPKAQPDEVVIEQENNSTQPTPIVNVDGETDKDFIDISDDDSEYYSDSDYEYRSSNSSIETLSLKASHKFAATGDAAAAVTSGIKKLKRVKFNFIVNSREIINGISIDYDFLDNALLNN